MPEPIRRPPVKLCTGTVVNSRQSFYFPHQMWYYKQLCWLLPPPDTQILPDIMKWHRCVIKMKSCQNQYQAWINRCSTAVWCFNIFHWVPWAQAWLIFHCGLGATGRSHSFTNTATDRTRTVITSFPAEADRFKSRYANWSLHSGRQEVSRLMTGAVPADSPTAHPRSGQTL